MSMLKTRISPAVFTTCVRLLTVKDILNGRIEFGLAVANGP
jgi:hypothetical protein